MASQMQETPRTSDGLLYFHAIRSYSPFGCPLTCSQQLFLHVDGLDGPSTLVVTFPIHHQTGHGKRREAQALICVLSLPLQLYRMGLRLDTNIAGLSFKLLFSSGASQEKPL